MRRATWTFVSQHAQVLDYDGTKLVLGIATVGLANTFRQGNHAELVRQALIDQIGVDVAVDGVATPATAASHLPDPAREVGSPPELTRTPLDAPDATQPDPPRPSARAAPVREELVRAMSARRVPPHGRATGDAMAAGGDRHTDGALGADDFAVSADDEDIHESGAAGREVVEKVLGGRVLGEVDES